MKTRAVTVALVGLLAWITPAHLVKVEPASAPVVAGDKPLLHWGPKSDRLRRLGTSRGRPLGLRGRHGPRKGHGLRGIVDVAGIPRIALKAYHAAARRAESTNPGCSLTWPVLAGIGRIESDHGTVGSSTYTRNGTLTPRLLGIQLNGTRRTAAISDSDGGRLDGDVVWDRAVGPMQFIPSTWRMYSADGNDDGTRDINNIFDAAAAAGDYLCAAGTSLAAPTSLAASLFSYNHSRRYVRTVLYVIAVYANQDPYALIAAAGPLAVPPPPRARPHGANRRHRRDRRQGFSRRAGHRSGTSNKSNGRRGAGGSRKRPASRPSPTPLLDRAPRAPKVSLPIGGTPSPTPTRR